MPDSLSLAGVIGIWVAAALVAAILTVILAALFLLQGKRRERCRALDAVDVQSTAFVSKGWRLSESVSFFRRIHVPSLREPPRLGNAFDIANDVEIRVNVSKTGWVNFAWAITMYAPRYDISEELVIRNESSWLPVHRFWIYAFGLRGRYTRRMDEGRGCHDLNGTHPRDDIIYREDVRDRGYYRFASAVKMHGITGCLWWRCTLGEASERAIDELYFGKHSQSDQRSLLPDNMSLSQLNWLATGYLPLTNDKESRVFVLPPFNSYASGSDWGESRKPVKCFYRYHPVSVKPVGWHEELAKMIGEAPRKVCMLHRERRPGNLGTGSHGPDGILGEWMPMPALPLDKEHQYFWATDMYKIAMTVLSSEISPHGYLFDQTRRFPLFFDTAHSWLPDLVSWLLLPQNAVSLGCQLTAVLRALSTVPLFVHSPHYIPHLSGSKAQALYDCDVLLQLRKWTIPSSAIHIIGILTLTSPTFRNVLGFTTVNPVLASDISISISGKTNIITTPSVSGYANAYQIDLEAVLGPQLYTSSLNSERYTQHFEIMLAGLKACIRSALLEYNFDSSPLVAMFIEMGDCVLVSSETRGPHLFGSDDGCLSPRRRNEAAGIPSVQESRESPAPSSRSEREFRRTKSRPRRGDWRMGKRTRAVRKRTLQRWRSEDDVELKETI